MEKKRVLGFYDYTVVLTYIGMLFAFSGIFLVFQDRFVCAIGCLMIAGVCDMFDGTIASTKNRNVYEKKFGIQIDSLADLISFGVLTSLLVYKITGCNACSRVAAGMYILCALIRLAYFNVSEDARQQMTTEHRSTYQGIPVTTIALVLPLMYLMYFKGVLQNRAWLSIALFVMSAGFISGFEVKKPRTVGKIVLIVIGIIEIVAIATIYMAGADIV